jgi:hypothetical protein
MDWERAKRCAYRVDALGNGWLGGKRKYSNLNIFHQLKFIY